MNSQAFATDVGATYIISFFFNTKGPMPPNTLDLAVDNLLASISIEQFRWRSFSYYSSLQPRVKPMLRLFETLE